MSSWQMVSVTLIATTRSATRTVAIARITVRLIVSKTNWEQSQDAGTTVWYGNLANDFAVPFTDGECDEDCYNEACGFDEGDCDSDSDMGMIAQENVETDDR
eukprot:scaffold233894_cov19-Prasinocladus_malaysianus.AAC.1